MATKLYQMATNYTIWPQTIPYGHKIYQMATNYTIWPQNILNGQNCIYQTAANYTKWPQTIPNGHNIFLVAVKYTNIFYSKALQNIPKVVFWNFEKDHLGTLLPTFYPFLNTLFILS
jgi:hypothetical protein